MKNIISYLKPSILAIALVVGLSTLQAAWLAPTGGTVPPASNPSAPVNVGTATQIKNGNFGVNGTISSAYADFVTETKSPKYCIGTSCITAWSQAGGAADNLGDHVADTNLNMSGFYISNTNAVGVTDSNPVNGATIQVANSGLIFVRPGGATRGDLYVRNIWSDTEVHTPKLCLNTTGTTNCFTSLPPIPPTCGAGSSLHWNGTSWSCDALVDISLGLNQTWQNTTPSGSVQQNNTGKPIMVFARARSTVAGNAAVTVNIDPNGINIPIAYGGPIAGSLVSNGVNVVIPPGAQFTISVAGTAPTYDKWVELK